ncbi:MAG: hypothetical protein CVT65_03860 [Actinobacteria bacterium HGW-Actinobacteria-5]|nr:MAG: hypothetical protein CVT65_03860 [Actinobacteria bacterium HGW-Actinobacteria-5]
MADITKVLKYVIIGDTSKAAAGLKGLSKDMKDTAKSGTGFKGLGNSLRDAFKTGGVKGLGGALKGAASEAGGLKGIVGKVGIGLAATGAAAVAAGAAIAVKFGADSVSTFKKVAGEVLKLKRITGLSTEDASRLGFAMKQSGVDATKGATGLKFLGKNLGNAADGGKKAAAMAKLLGFGFTDASGKVKPMADLMPKLADKFASMPDGAEKTALAMKLFGRSGTDMLPFLNKGADGLAKLAKKSDEFGNTLTDKDLDALKQSKQAQRDWDAAMQGLQVTLGKYLLPVLTQFATMINSAAIPAMQGIAQWIEKNHALFDGLGQIVRWVWNNVLLPAFKLAIWGLTSQAIAAGQLVAAMGRLTGNKDMENFGNAVVAAAQDTQEWANSLQGIPDEVAPTIDTKTDQATKKVTAINGKIQGLKDKLVTARAKGDTKEVDRLKTKIDKLRDKRIAITTDLKKGKGVTFGGTLKIGSDGTARISMRRRGGPVRRGHLYGVNEEGLELFAPQQNGYIIPAGPSRQIMAAAAGGGGGRQTVAQFNFSVPPGADQHAFGRMIRKALVDLQRDTGLVVP